MKCRSLYWRLVMITLTFYGLDQYIVGNFSKTISHNLAELYEMSEDEINFIAPKCMIFHDGVDQTSWNLLIRVNLPMKLRALQNEAAEIIMSMVQGPTINVAVEFYYYSEDDRYERINKDYPRFITDDNEIEIEENDGEEYVEGEGEDEVFTGDIFEDFKE